MQCRSVIFFFKYISALCFMRQSTETNVPIHCSSHQWYFFCVCNLIYVATCSFGKWPLHAAQCKGRAARLILMSAQALYSSNSLDTPIWPNLDADIKGVWCYLAVTLTSLPRFRDNSNRFISVAAVGRAMQSSPAFFNFDIITCFIFKC